MAKAQPQQEAMREQGQHPQDPAVQYQAVKADPRDRLNSVQVRTNIKITAEHLLARRQAVRDRYAMIETVPGSGWHDSDRLSPQKADPPRMRLKDYLVRLEDRRGDFHLIGEDAELAMTAIQAVVEELQSKPMTELMTNGSWVNIVTSFPGRYQLEDLDGTPHLVLWKEDWNDILLVLERAGLGTACVPVEGTSV
jgi:hypothetical protein